MGPVAYFSLCLLGCLIFSPSLAGAQDVSCPKDWLPFQGNCYGYFFQEKTRLEAEERGGDRGWKQQGSGALGWSWRLRGWGGLGSVSESVECRHHGNGAHLVSIQSAGENNMMAHYIKWYHKKNSPVWIGLLDLEENRGWRWADKSLVSFSAWDNGQPDNRLGNENCVVLENAGFQKWHDYPCEERFSFICKRKP
ncbi:C-type lectin-like [Dermochelys coriacea]|uniref:C-type lectin-like n=1 Tax=Dermochelys coriacea TaxID=27794 RepID=UPI001CA928BB|nr:C-type lectin-like [Dermochelys coriacea]